MNSHCIHGHAFTPENTYWHMARKDGYAHRQCKACKKRSTRLCYRNNESYRERTKQKARDRHYAKRAAAQAQQADHRLSSA